MIRTTMLYEDIEVNVDDLQKCIEAEQKGNRQLRRLLNRLIERYKGNVEKQILLTNLCRIKAVENQLLDNDELYRIYMVAYVENDNGIVDNAPDHIRKKYCNAIYGYDVKEEIGG